MRGYVEKEKAWKRSWLSDTPQRASLMQLHMAPYHDGLVQDMMRWRGESKVYTWKWSDWYRKKGVPIPLVPHMGRDFAYVDDLRPLVTPGSY